MSVTVALSITYPQSRLSTVSGKDQGPLVHVYSIRVDGFVTVIVTQSVTNENNMTFQFFGLIDR